MSVLLRLRTCLCCCELAEIDEETITKGPYTTKRDPTLTSMNDGSSLSIDGFDDFREVSLHSIPDSIILRIPISESTGKKQSVGDVPAGEPFEAAQLEYLTMTNFSDRPTKNDLAARNFFTPHYRAKKRREQFALDIEANQRHRK